jgi:hypothetical protein
MTRRRFGKRGRAAYGFLSNDSGILFHPSVRAVLLDHLVVDPQQQERGGPLADEQGMNRVKVNAVFVWIGQCVENISRKGPAELQIPRLRDDKQERVGLWTGPLPRDKAVVGARNPLATASISDCPLLYRPPSPLATGPSLQPLSPVCHPERSRGICSSAGPVLEMFPPFHGPIAR